MFLIQLEITKHHNNDLHIANTLCFIINFLSIDPTNSDSRSLQLPDKRKFISLDCKTLCFQIEIISSAFCVEFQNTVVWIGNTALIKHCVAFAPYHIFCFLVGQHFHFAFQHNTHVLNQAFMIEINTGIRITQTQS